MLNIIAGGAKSGKSTLLVQTAAELSSAGKQCIFVVPEQISFEYERSLSAALSPRQQAFVAVKSFRSLCADIFKKHGGGAKQRVDSTAKLSLVRRAVSAAGSSVQFFKRHSRTPAFYSLMSEAIDELKRSGITPQALADMAQGLGEQRAKRARFTETAAIYSCYEALLGKKYTDDASELDDARTLCADGEFADRTVFLDCFDGFSHGELQLIERMLSDGAQIYCSLYACDPFEAQPPLAQAVPAMTARRLAAAAKNSGTDYRVQKLGSSAGVAAGIAALENALQSDTEIQGTRGLCLFRPKNRSEELSWVCAEISRLVREDDFRYSDIAVITNDFEGYEASLRDTFANYEIPCFCDFHSDLLCTPLVVMATALTEAAVWGLNTDTLLRIAKCGLCSIDSQTADELENYVFVWGTEFSDWKKPFVGNPRGYEDFTAEDEQLLARVEQARQFLVNGTLDFTEKLKKSSGTGVARLLYAACEQLGAAECIQRISQLHTPEADEQVRCYNLGTQMLQTLDTVLGTDEITPQEFAALLRGQAGSTSLYNVPNTLDAVLVGQAARTRAFNIKAAFVVGLNDGLFPADNYPQQLLTEGDRDYMAQCGYPLQTTFETRLCLEQTYFCRALSLPQQLLYMSSPRFDTQGSALALSGALKLALGKHMNDITRSISFSQQCCTKTAALVQLSRAYGRLNSDYASLVRSLELADMSDAAEQFVALVGQRPFEPADPATCDRFFGGGLNVSPTLVDDFYKCRFAYFMRDVIGVRPLKTAKLTPLESGKYIHYVLQNALESLKGKLETATPEQINESVSHAAAKYIEEYMGGYDTNSPRVLHIFEKLKNRLSVMVSKIALEQRESEFVPELFELRVGFDSSLPSHTLVTREGHTVSIRGIVDRVDVLRKDGHEYIRVVDYKTSGKEFSLTDVYYGLGIQMLAYMFILCNGENKLFSSPSPAGVLYMSVDPSQDKLNSGAEVDGLLVDNDDLKQALSPQLQSRFFPTKGNAKKRLASLEQLGKLQRHIDGLLVEMAQEVYSGSFPAQPLFEPDSQYSHCDYCDYSTACARFADRGARTKTVDGQQEFLGVPQDNAGGKEQE